MTERRPVREALTQLLILAGVQWEIRDMHNQQRVVAQGYPEDHTRRLCERMNGSVGCQRYQVFQNF